MSQDPNQTVGQIEKKTQARVVALFRETLGYEYLGNWIDNENNRNIEEAFLRPFLKDVQGYDDTLVSRALFELGKVAGNQSRSLYDVNRSAYDLLRYGVKVRPDIGENTQTVWLIDWANPESNHFAIAEEVTVKPAGAKAFGKRPDIVLYVNGIALGVLELKRSTVSVSLPFANQKTEAEKIRDEIALSRPERDPPAVKTIERHLRKLLAVNS